MDVCKYIWCFSIKCHEDTARCIFIVSTFYLRFFAILKSMVFNGFTFLLDFTERVSERA